MRRSVSLSTLCFALTTACLLPAVRAADMEVKDPAGRPVLLKDDGTWRYLDGKGSKPAAVTESAQLQLLRQTDDSGGCSYEFEFDNTLPYEVRSLVPYFAVVRANGVVYATESLSFGPVKPGAKTQRTLRFSGITCGEVTKVQVQGGDRCEMGELSRFTESPGACLSRLRVQPSTLVKFEK